MSIKYVCYYCRKVLNISGFPVVNEAGRKYCDRCGSNKDTLDVVEEDDFGLAVLSHTEASPS